MWKLQVFFLLFAPRVSTKTLFQHGNLEIYWIWCNPWKHEKTQIVFKLNENCFVIWSNSWFYKTNHKQLSIFCTSVIICTHVSRVYEDYVYLWENFRIFHLYFYFKFKVWFRYRLFYWDFFYLLHFCISIAV